jgi:tetratricopeptide (TPR) repeat protein
VVGATINLAARLMQASGGDGILCDEATERDARRQLDFAPLDPVPVKGRAEPVFVLRPAGRRAPSGSPARTELIGRQSEFDRIARGLEISAQGRPGGCFLVEAEAGMGKSTLLAAVCDHARARGLSVARGQADSIESSTPYFPLRSVFAHALALPGEPGAEDVERAARERLRGAAELEPLLPLLKAVVSVELPENDRTRQMTGQVRADNTSRLLLGLLRAAARASPLLLAVEDGHWMDSASWGLLLQIARLRDSVTVVLTTRPPAEPQPAYQALCTLAGSTHLRLASMEAGELAALVAHRLGVERLPESMRRLLAERAGGNPFHAEEIALALRDKGLITVTGGACRVVSEAALAELVLPDTLLGTIAARVDRLPAAAQLTAKVASAVGRVFETSMLCGIHPIADDRGAVRDHLELLTRADLICPEPKQHEPAHAFRHAVIQESLYQSLSFAQRRSLNRAAAEHLEASHADRASIVARLAFHYSEAEMAPEAMSALLAAGKQALDAYANREAVRFLARSLEFPEAARRPRLERVQTHRHLCEAHYALTEYAKSRQTAAEALRAAGCRVPDGTLRGIAAELVTLWRQALREALTGRRAAALEADAREARVAACYALGSVMSVFAFEGEALASARGALQVYNMGAAVEPSAVTSGGRLGYGMLLSRLGWWGRAEPMLRRAVREAEASGDVLHVIQAYALFGQQWTGVGDFEQAVKWLDRADTLASDLGTSLWRHRTKLELSNALMCLGRYEECMRQTELGGRIALDAEPKTFGIFLAKQAVALLRLGRDDEAQPLLDEGLARSREHSAALPLFVAFGGLAELHLRRGDPEAALAAAREAERIALTEKGADAFFPSVHGHAGICHVYLELWGLARETGGSPPVLPLAEARAGARRACRLLAAFSRIYPSARPLHDLMEGRRQHLLGRAARAERRWRRAAAGAEATGQPHESALARLWLGLHGPEQERAAQLERAAATFSRYGMAYELRSIAGGGV